MFYGASIAPGKTVTPSDENGEILHLSQIALKDPKAEGRTVVEIEHKGSKFVLCSLQKDKVEHVSVDLFLAPSEESDFKFSTSGAKNEVHILGYYEPTMDGSDSGDDDDMMGNFLGSSQAEEASGDDEPDSEDVERAIMEPKVKAIQAKQVAAKLTKAVLAKQVPKKIELSDESDEDAEEIMESTEASPEATANSDEEDSNEEHSQESEQAKPAPKQAAGKRKQPESPTTPPAKKAKVEVATTEAGKTSAGEQQYTSALVAFLKKNGRTALGTLGSRVKKPDSVSQKLGIFIKSRSDVFKVENGNVSLAKA